MAWWCWLAIRAPAWTNHVAVRAKSEHRHAHIIALHTFFDFPSCCVDDHQTKRLGSSDVPSVFITETILHKKMENNNKRNGMPTAVKTTLFKYFRVFNNIQCIYIHGRLVDIQLLFSFTKKNREMNEFQKIWTWRFRPLHYFRPER